MTVGRNKTEARKAYNKALHAKRFAEDPAYREARREAWRKSYYRKLETDPEYAARARERSKRYYAKRKAEMPDGKSPWPGKASKVTSKPGPRRQCVECGTLHTGGKPRCGACRGG